MTVEVDRVPGPGLPESVYEAALKSKPSHRCIPYSRHSCSRISG
jgi:hypothetical protein